jgi:hypothetical protein
MSHLFAISRTALKESNHYKANCGVSAECAALYTGPTPAHGNRGLGA